MLIALLGRAAATVCLESDECIAANGTAIGWNNWCGDGSCDCSCYADEHGPVVLGRDAWQTQAIVRLMETHARMIEQIDALTAIVQKRGLAYAKPTLVHAPAMDVSETGETLAEQH